MASALFHPEFKAAPYWWETWRPNADGSADPPARADVAIVGAGYGGLAATLELRRAGTAVVVMEANEFVSGASSRNGGAVSTLAMGSWAAEPPIKANWRARPRPCCAKRRTRCSCSRRSSRTPRVLTYYRMSPDGRRVLFGGRARFTQVGPQVSVPGLHRMMTQRFPQLARVRVTHAWTGNVAFTFDFLPHMGRHDGMHYVLGCNGSGVAMMTYLGTRTARKILGGANRVSALDQRDFPTVLLYGGNPWFLPPVGGYYRLRDRLDRWMA